MVLKKPGRDLEAMGAFHLVGGGGVDREKTPTTWWQLWPMQRIPPYQILLKAVVQLLSIFPGMLFGGMFVEWLYTSHFIDSCAQQTNREVLSRSNIT